MCGLQAVDGQALGAALAGFEQVANHFLMCFTCLVGGHLYQQRGIARRTHQRQLLGVVLDLPARRGGECNTQRRVVKVLATGQTLGGTFTKSHATDGLKITLTPFVGVVTFVLGRQLGDHLQTLVIAGV